MKVLGPTADFPTWGSSKRLSIARNLTLKVSRILLQDFQRTGETETLGVHEQNLCTPGPRKE